MAVLCEAISVIIKKSSIDTFYVGGWNAFTSNIPNQTICSDGELVRIGFFSPKDVETFIFSLESQGLVFQKPSTRKNDIIVVDQHRGPTLHCDWIEFGKFNIEENIKVSMCWLFEENRKDMGIHLKDLKMKLATPKGWKAENYKSIHFKE